MARKVPKPVSIDVREAPENQKGFKRFYEEHYQMGYRYLRAMRFPHNDIEDLLARSFEIAWSRFAEFAEAKNPKYWFYGILKNQAGYNRRKQAGDTTLSIDGSELAIRSRHDGPHEQLQKKEEKSYFYETIRALPEKYQQVVNLRLEGFDYSEISGALEITVAAAHSRMRRALEKLEAPMREFIEEYGID